VGGGWREIVSLCGFNFLNYSTYLNIIDEKNTYKISKFNENHDFLKIKFGLLTVVGDSLLRSAAPPVQYPNLTWVDV
jgi:hypothetical protein